MNGIPRSAIKWIALLVGAVMFALLVVAPLSWKDQAVVSGLIFALALILNRISTSRIITITLILLSVFSSLRYFAWRLAETWNAWSAAGTDAIELDLIFVLLLLGAESYALLILALGYFQTIRPLERKPVPMPADTTQWPSIDVFIPTYNEPLDVVRSTVMAARAMDWPPEKITVHLLDDGRRAEFKQFAARLGMSYFTRSDNAHAKAGNINNALKKTSGEYVVIFDCDHIPTRSFLQMTLSWLLRDPKLAMLQTPHQFYSPDPFERNLQTFRRVPNEGSLFYGIVQDGNDLWNATFFCGSAAVIRRSALVDIGGIAVETVTEDAHTSLRLQRRGWNTAYISLPLTSGLATASLSDHITQRIRWARGMVQILRVENPLFSSGLTFAQRLCYFNCMVHFLYALPRLIFLTSPLVYLLLGRSNFYGYAAAIAAYAFPHLALATLTNSRVQGKFRHSFWNEIYETVLSPYILLPTMAALINPRWGKFNVTPKARNVEHTHLDWRIATPFLVLMIANIAGLAAGIPRLFNDPEHMGTVAVNIFWTLANVWILSAAIAAAEEHRQVRKVHRIDIETEAEILLPAYAALEAETINVSLGGAALRADAGDAQCGDRVSLLMRAPGVEVVCPGSIVDVQPGIVRIGFDELSLEQQDRLTRFLFGRANSWLRWNDRNKIDHPLRSLALILCVSFKGAWAVVADLFRRRPQSSAHDIALAAPSKRGIVIPLILLVAAALTILVLRSSAAPSDSSGSLPRFSEKRDFQTLGYKNGLEIRGLTGRATLRFGLPVSKLVNRGRLRLRYRAAASLLPGKSRFQVILNGSPVAVLPVEFNPDGASLPAETAVDLPSDLFVVENTLQIVLSGECASCGGRERSGLRTLIEAASELEMEGSVLQLANDARMLPAPFFFSSNEQSLTLPVVFGAPPDRRTLEAAGIVSSWMGILSDHRGASFPVLVGEIPTGNVVVFAVSGSPLAEQLGLKGKAGPAIAIRNNPRDSYSKVLVLLGAGEAEWLTAARALALQQSTGSGDFVSIAQMGLPSPRQPHDAPRWVRTGTQVPLIEKPAPDQYKVYGDGVAQVFFRIPPDLHFDSHNSVPLTVSVQSSKFGGARAAIQVRLNEQHLGTIALAPSDAGKVITKTYLVPVPAIYPRNTLSVEFSYQGTTAGETVPEGQVLANTRLDLRDIPHFVRLPRLDLFAKAGFPFTEMADLSSTAAVLPDQPTTAEITTYLDTVAFLAAQTGYPAIRVGVENAAEARQEKSRDLLVIGTAEDQPLFQDWALAMPVAVTRSAWRVSSQAGRFDGLLRFPWRTDSKPDTDLAENLEGNLPAMTLIQGFADPQAPGRAVIAIATRNSTSAPSFGNLLNQVAASGASGTTVITQSDSGIHSFLVPAGSVDRGDLGPVDSFDRWLQQNLLLMPLMALLLCAGAALAVAGALDRRVLSRLRTGA